MLIYQVDHDQLRGGTYQSSFIFDSMWAKKLGQYGHVTEAHVTVYKGNHFILEF